MELYVNDVLRKVQQVPTGPFVIDNSLGLTGSGETRSWCATYWARKW